MSEMPGWTRRTLQGICLYFDISDSASEWHIMIDDGSLTTTGSYKTCFSLAKSLLYTLPSHISQLFSIQLAKTPI
jgi:hypothetical protein